MIAGKNMARAQYIISLFLLQSCLSFCTEEKGCLQGSSCVSLPQNTPKECQEKRCQDLEKERTIYKLTKPSTTISTAENAATTPDIKSILSCPLLDLTIPQVVGLAKMDPNQQQWLALFGYIGQRNDNFTKLYSQNPRIFECLSDYIDLYEKALAFQVVNPALEPFFQIPSTVQPFKDIMRTGDWKNDNVFTDQRLAGLNVHSIKGVYYVRRGRKTGAISFRELKEKLNGDFDWNEAFTEAVHRRVTMRGMVRSGSVFVVSFSIMKNLTNVPDITGDPRVLRSSTSPIAVFVSTQDDASKTNTLKPVAIQIDETPGSPVYTPKDGSQWLMAKTAFQLADFTYLEMVEHLTKAHFLFESICVTLRRTLSLYHPLMQIMEHHCIGLFVTNSVGVPLLLGKDGTMHKLFSIGNVGSIELVNRAYAELSWDDYDFDRDLTKRGVTNKRKLPYYPYRDDGRVIFNLLKRFANAYVNTYYHTNRDVLRDKELQNFANELSRDGTGVDGGIGMLRGFPSKIRFKAALKTTLSRILWVVMRHHTVNYPLVDYYGTFVPNMPSKLYDVHGVPDYEFSLKRLSASPSSAGQVSLGFSLASLRYDHLFDYSKKMDDKLGGCLVQKYYDELMSSDIKCVIEKRNRKRKEEGHLTYPYLQPGWIPNSIHT